MRRPTWTTLFFAVVALLVVATAAAGGHPEDAGRGNGSEGPTDQVIIRLAPGTSFDLNALSATAGESLRRARRLTDGRYVLKLSGRSDAAGVHGIVQRLTARGDVVSVEEDAMMHPLADTTPNDPLWSEQWDMFDPASSGLYGLSLPGAWQITSGSPGITVGVIDTGYRPHADLSGRFVDGYDFIGDSLVANDGGGRDADALDPGDWITRGENRRGYFRGCGTSNSSWHGTHVSGTIGAVSNNGLGVAGINGVSKIQPLRVLGKCGGYTSDIADAIRWGAGLSVSGISGNPTPDRVVNLSLGGSGSCSSTLQSAINAAVAAGTVVVVAAGNSNANASNFSPANCDKVITVAATAKNGKRAYYSNYGSTVEIAAPGGDYYADSMILSTLNAGLTTPGADSYAYYQGTSMATPHVVGVVSLMLSVNPSLTPAQVSSMLQASATPFPAGSTCTTSLCGAGIVNAAAAVAAANGGAQPTAPGAFAKTAPANGSQFSGTSATLQWGAASGALGYEYCIDQSNDGTCSSNWLSTGTGTSVAVSGLAAGTYYWQVKAGNLVGETLANGGVMWAFTAQAAPAGPGAFSKTSPTNGQTNLLRPVTIAWGSSTGATSYEWCVSTSASCPSDGWQTASGTSATVSGLNQSTVYHWQVQAKNATGTTPADGGTWWTFTTPAASGLPGAFSKTSPTNGQQIRSRSVTLLWDTSQDASGGYEWCLSTTSGSCSNWTQTTGTSATASVSSRRTYYYWQVRAINDSGTTDANGGSLWSFRTR